MPTGTRTAALLIAIVAAFALVLYLAYGGNDGDSSATPTPSPVARGSPSPSSGGSPTPAGPLPAVLEGTRVSTLQAGNLVQFPRDIALITETGCWQCDGGSTGLRRMYKDPITDELRVEQLLAIQELGVANPDAYFTGIAVAPNASYMIASVCVRGECPFGLHGWSEDARTSLFESRDGGVTWRKVAEYERALSVEGLVGPETALVSWYEQSPPAPRLYGTYPGLEPVTSPGDTYFPVLNNGPEILWTQFDDRRKIARTNRDVVLDLGDRSRVSSEWLNPFTPDRPMLLQWVTLIGGVGNEFAANPRTFISFVDESGEIVSTHEMHPGSATMLSALPYEAGTLIGTMANPPLIDAPNNFLGLLPAILDLAAGRYNMIEEPFLEPDYDFERDIVHAVQHGPFARVNIPGSCLNVREGPALVASIVTCAGDGVLFRHDGVTAFGDDTTWLRVTTPRGVEGWAAVTFLEYEAE